MVTPRGEKVYKFVVVAEDKQGYFLQILNIISGHYVNLSSSFTYSDISTGTFLTNVIGDLRKADKSAAEIKREIASLPFVKSVEVESAQDVLFDRMLFPLTIAGDLRAVVLPVDALQERERRMLANDGGREAIIDTQRPAGVSLTATIRRYLPWVHTDALVEASVDALCALGWGYFEFDTTAVKQGKVGVSVKYPIFSELPGDNVSYSIVGIAAGVLEGIYGLRFTPQSKVTYDAEEKEMSFELVGAHKSGKAGSS
jgi:hypothetical protein